jgi:hypothetical protein
VPHRTRAAQFHENCRAAGDDIDSNDPRLLRRWRSNLKYQGNLLPLHVPQDPKTKPGVGPYPQLASNKRRFVRFPAMCRVEYKVGERSTFVFTQDLSLGGMQLRNVKSLARGDTLTFHLHLIDGAKPVGVEGLVQRLSGTSAGVTFLPEQEPAIQAVHEFIGQRLISRAAERASGSSGSASQVADLAMYYCEIGRIDDALELYRKSLQRRSQELVLYEQMATLLLYRIEQGGAGAWALVAELETLIGRGLRLGKSRSLDAINQDVADLRKKLALAQQESQRREKEALLKEVDAHAVRIKRELEAQTEIAIRKGVAEKARELEQAFRAKLEGKEVRAQMAQQHKEGKRQLALLEQALTKRRAMIAREEEKFSRTRAKLEKDQQAFAAAQEKFATADRLLHEREKKNAALDKALSARARDVALREAAVASLEQITQAIAQLHAANHALRAGVPKR